MPIIADVKKSQETNEAFRTLVRSASRCNKVPKWIQWSLPVCQLTSMISVILLGSNLFPPIALVKIALSDLEAGVLSVIVIVSLTGMALWIKKNNSLVEPILLVMKQHPELASATEISHEIHEGRKVSIIKSRSGELLCGLAFNPADTELVQRAYQSISKKPPKIINNLGG